MYFQQLGSFGSKTEAAIYLKKGYLHFRNRGPPRGVLTYRLIQPFRFRLPNRSCRLLP